MEKVKLYRLTEHAEQQFRKGARQAKNITKEALNCKMSALIYASRDRIYYSDVDGCAAFGTCLITFAQDEVIDIHWSKDDHRCGISRKEKEALTYAYAYFGMDDNGERFL